MPVKIEVPVNNFRQRTLTGLLLVIVMTLAIRWNAYSFLLIAALIDALGLIEFYRLFENKEIIPRKTAAIALGSCLIFFSSLLAAGIISLAVALILVPLPFLIFLFELYSRSDKPFHNLAFTFLGVLCISVPLCFLAGIACLPHSSGSYQRDTLTGYFFILWCYDTAAYLSGRLLGRHPLFKRISPGKTWEGFAGGAAGALLIAYLVSRFFTELTLSNWLSLALIVVFFGTYGDLIKSLMKRSAGVKDSGTILPGHGGVLDRFDSLLGSAPFVFCYLTFAGYA
jgi:phosphatidate cytidylyltransferase